MDLDLSKDAARLCPRGYTPRPISAMAFDPSSHLLALVIGPVVFVHEIPGGARRDEHRIKLPRPMAKEFTDRDIDDSIDPSELAFGCEGRRLAVLSELMINNNGDAFRWLSVFETGVRSPRFVVFPPEALEDLENTYGCRTWAISPDGATMVTYCEYELRLWDLATGASRDFPAPSPSPSPSRGGFNSDCDAEFAFDASGRHLAVASSGRFGEAPRVQIIELSSGRVVAAHRLKDASPPMFPHLGFVAGPDGVRIPLNPATDSGSTRPIVPEHPATVGAKRRSPLRIIDSASDSGSTRPIVPEHPATVGAKRRSPLVSGRVAVAGNAWMLSPSRP